METKLSKIGIIPDMHFQPFLRYADYITDRRIPEKKKILDFVVKTFSDCDKIVFIGDLLNSRNSPSFVIKELTNFIERFDGKEVFILIGNHEHTPGKSSPLDFLGEIKNKNWHIINDFEIINDLAFCSYHSKASLEVKNYEEATEKLLGRLKPAKMLFVHHTVSDVVLTSGLSVNDFPEIVLPKKELEKKYKKIIAGHIHKPQIKDNVIVTGSLFNNEVGEIEKFIWKIDEKTLEAEQIKIIGQRPIYKLENPTDKELEAIDKSSIVKVIITKKKTSKEISELKQKLKKFDAYLFIEKVPRERKKLHYGGDESLLDIGIEKLLEIYAKDREVDLDKLNKGFALINI